MMFSIIVPVCNGEDYIEACVKSALSQSAFAGDRDEPFEVIIVENGSADNTPGICDELAAKDNRVRVLHKGKIGLFAARQAGISVARGEWILSLDSDDELSEDALKILSEEIASLGAGGGADLIIFDAKELETGKRLHTRPFSPGVIYLGNEKKVIIDQFCRDDSLNSMWTKCVRRSIAGLAKTDIYLNYGEDLYQTAEYLDRARGVLYLDKVIYRYRRDAVSLSSSYSEVYLDNEKITWAKLDELARKWEEGTMDELISQRKSLTCTIALTKLIQSSLSMKEKKYKLEKLLNDEFYKKYALLPLPSWAPEEARFVKELQLSKDPVSAILKNSMVSGIKRWIKERIRNGN